MDAGAGQPTTSASRPTKPDTATLPRLQRLHGEGLVPRPVGAFRRTAEGFATHAGGVDVSLPSDAHLPFSLATKATTITVRALGARPVVGRLEGGALVYPGAFADANLVHVPLANGTDELVELTAPRPDNRLSWELRLVSGAAGLRVVGGVVEVLRADGNPELHVPAPVIVDADQQTVTGSLDVEGCQVDRDPRMPWGRPVIAPGATVCTLVARFDDTGLRYPLLVDPAWTSTTAMAGPRAGHQAIGWSTATGPCAGSCVLVAGGIGGGMLATAEIYNATTASWAATGSLTTKRRDFGAVLFGGSKIVVAGGQVTSGTPVTYTASVESYDLATGVWTVVGALPGGARANLAAAAVTGQYSATAQYAQAIFAGGKDATTFSKAVDAYTDTNLADATPPTLTAFTAMNNARAEFAIGGRNGSCGATTCADTRQFVVAGGNTASGATASIEKITGAIDVAPPTNWNNLGSLTTARYDMGFASLGRDLWLGGGQVGISTMATEVTNVDMLTGTVTTVGNLSLGRHGLAAAIADYGGSKPVAVFVGGTNASGSPLATVDAAAVAGVIGVSPLAIKRNTPAATRLPTTGAVLVTGGRDGAGGSLASAELLVPLATGSVCVKDGDCASTFCTDGFCCAAACLGQCQACNLPGKEGTCTKVTKTNGPIGYPAGQAVAGFGTDRPLCAPFGDPCGFSCDGTSTSACALTSPRPTCIKHTCVSGVETFASTCDALGFCPTPAPATQLCKEYACGGAGVACRTSCSDNTHCAAGYKCNTTSAKCEPTGELGAACTTAGDCKTAGCVDGVCCASAACASGLRCDTLYDKGHCKLPDGATCTTGGACGSGNCVDGYCCDTSCTGQCQACDVAGQLGKCQAVAGAVHGTRTKCLGSGSCQAKCDGVNGLACGAPPGVTTLCATASCTAGVETPVRYCDGAGVCKPPVTKKCNEYTCGGTECRASCSGPTDCATGYSCIAGSCVTSGDPGTVCTAATDCKSGNCIDGVCCTTASCSTGLRCDANGKGTCSKPTGATCTTTTECGSGFCVDGTCCDAKCDGQCEACDVSGSVGKCLPVVGKPHGARTACSGTGDCQAQCNGADRLTCGTPPGSSTTCATPSCDGAAGIAKPAAYCDGAGNCTPPKAVSCKPYTCDAIACKSVCLAETDCATGYTCKDNACVPKAGTACTAPTDCTSGFCVDGVCCNSACTGQCQACDVPGAAGTCTAIVGDPHGTRTKCSDGGADVCKALTCDGVDGTKCAAFSHGVETACTKASCVAGVLTEEAVCDNKGSCGVAKTRPCAPFVCDGTAKCKTSCATSADCAPGTLCTSGNCAAVTAKCKDDGTASIATDGSKEEPCNGYRCDPTSGRCRDKCTSASDCQPGFACDADGRCSPSSAPVAEEGGCAFASSGHPTAGLGALLALAALSTRRRRS